MRLDEPTLPPRVASPKLFKDRARPAAKRLGAGVLAPAFCQISAQVVAVLAAVSEPALAGRKLWRKGARVAQPEHIVDMAELAVLVLALVLPFTILLALAAITAVTTIAAVAAVAGTLGAVLDAAFGGIVVNGAAALARWKVGDGNEISDR